MKLLTISVLVFILGFALGGWPLRSDQLVLEGEIEELKAQLADKAYKGNPSLSGITQMLNVPEQEEVEEEPEAEEVAEVEESADESEPVVEEVVAETEPEEPPEEESFSERIEKAADLWLVRSDIARQSFLDTVAASDEQALRFDVVVEAMNVRLEGTIAQWADVLAADTMPPSEAGIRMMKDITEALTIAYDDLDQSMPASWSRDAGETFQITDYIDPVVAMPLADVEGKLDFR